MDDDIGLISSSSSVTSVTCSSKKSHQSMSCDGKQRLHSGSFSRRSSSPSITSSSSSRRDEISTNRTSMTNDSVSSSSSSVFIEEKAPRLETNKLIKRLENNGIPNSSKKSSHRASYSDDYENELNSICDLSKMKLKKEEIGFLSLIHECQGWIEATSNSKFLYPNDFRRSLENGVILCELLNVLKKNCVRRINRHSTPIAGIDNLNVFLKACQEHFQLIQANLFDITDLEDLNRRRGGITSPNNCYTVNDIKEPEDLNIQTNEKSNCNPNLNDYLTDEEQKRRLKKVINTINWLSRKAIELGIQIPYHFDINNPTNHLVKPSLHHHNNHIKALGCSYNSVSSSTSSTSSSSSYCSSFSNSSLNQYSTTSSLTSSSSLSVIVATSPLLPPHNPSVNSKISSPKPIINSTSSQSNLLKKRHSTQSSFKNLDEIDTAQQPSSIDENNTNKPALNQISQVYTMSYIYKQQQSNLNGGKLATSLVNKRSTSLQIDPSSSSSSNSSSSSTSSEYNSNQNLQNDLIRKDSVETIDSISNSSNNSSLINKNSSASSPGNRQNTQENHKNQYLADSQDDLQLIDSTMSPISSTNSAAVSPRLTISTSSSSNNISNSNTNLNTPSNINANNSLNNGSTTMIPTRYIDRRVSNTVVEQKFNVNYSEAGQRLARKAEEQLKTVEKGKEQKKQYVKNNFMGVPNNVNKNGPSLLQAALAYNKKSTQPTKPKSNGSGGGSENDDWQNSVDDWKKRRREKKNLPAPRTSMSGDFEQDEEDRRAKSERRRINRFEHSIHYLSPPRNEEKKSDETTNIIQNKQECNPEPEQASELNNEIKLEPKNQTPTLSKAATIEISGVSINEPVSNKLSIYASSNKSNNSTENITQNNKDTSTTNNSNLNESVNNDEDDSIICTDFKYTFKEKFVNIDRPYDHKSRGFGFLLNSGLLNKNNNSLKKLNDENINKILSQNYAQIVVVEHDSLADQAGLQKGDLVTNINEAPTSNLNNEQLRKIMRQRLQQNSVQLNLLHLDKVDSDSSKNNESLVSEKSANANETLESVNLNVDKVSPVNITSTTAANTSISKPQLGYNSKTTSNSQLQQQADYHQIVAPKPYKKSTSNAALTNPSLPTLPDQPKIQQISEVQEKEEIKLETIENDDTDHDNEESEDFLDRKLPPPVPVTAPPPLPKSRTNSILAENESNDSEKSSNIKKALLDNMKCVENWKTEQELLMKRKYEEGQKKIEISLKSDLEKVREEENQRREQERLKLEKERLRLQELELKQKEKELYKHTEFKNDSASKDKSGTMSEEKNNVLNNNESVRNEDLNALIEKIYTEETEEIQKDIQINLDQEEFTKSNDFAEAQTNSINSNTTNSFQSPKSNKTSIVMTKTSPIVAAELDFEDIEDFDMDKKTDYISNKNIEPSKHEILKQVHDSMDHLRTTLLKKGTTLHVNQDKDMNDKQGETSKKMEEVENLKREQETIRVEKEKIEKEKERLRQEAEQLRIERELIFLAKTSKIACNAITATSGTISSSTSSTSSANDQLDSDLMASNENQANSPIDHYKILNQFTGPKSIPIVFPSSSGLQNNHSKSNTYQNVQPQHWLIEEAERQRLNKKMSGQRTSENTEQYQHHRRSVPNLLMETNTQVIIPNYQKQNISHHGNYQNNSYTHQSSAPTAAMTRIYKQKKSDSSNYTRPSPLSHKYQQLPRNTNPPISTTIPSQCISKPPSNPRQISTSQSDLKNLTKHQQSQYQRPNSHSHSKLSNSTSSLTPKGNNPIISLNQKCSCCSQMLGQGSAMFIEKLGLAFHLKCFRCSVCNVPLGNGKEGTDVRVSVTNRLHCNNCFSNDLGKIYFNFNFLHFDFTNMNKKNDLSNNEKDNNIEHKHRQAVNHEQNKSEIYYKMYKMPLSKKYCEKKVSDDYLIIPNYLTSSATNSTTIKRHSSYKSFTNTFNF